MKDMLLHNKNILLGVTGGIAAYKSAELVRLFIKSGANVQVVMTKAAQAFVTPLTFQALSGRPVSTELLDPDHEASMGHISLARWADLLVIAPASANTLARLAHGYADDLLSTLCLACAADKLVAPAMNQQMWQNPATQANVKTLQSRHFAFIGPEPGSQACGETGPGRLSEPADIHSAVEQYFSPGLLDQLHVLITAGPTREPIDPVRFLSNRSSGKMGYAIAAAAAAQGASVTLISGPVSLKTPKSVTRLDVETAKQMHSMAIAKAEGHDIFIATAAVSDYRVTEVSPQKIKKTADNLTLDLTRNADILADVSALTNRPFCVGFAAETHDLAHYAKQKLTHKRLDMVAANPVNDGLGFDQNDNQLEVYWSNGHKSLPRTTKQQLANQLVELIAHQFTQKKRKDASN